MEIVRGKALYPYEYMNSFARFEETDFPPREAFYSSSKGEMQSEKEYARAKAIYEKHCKNLGEYHDFYVLSNTLLLADVYEELTLETVRDVRVDPAH